MCNLISRHSQVLNLWLCKFRLHDLQNIKINSTGTVMRAKILLHGKA